MTEMAVNQNFNVYLLRFGLEYLCRYVMLPTLCTHKGFVCPNVERKSARSFYAEASKFYFCFQDLG